MNLRVTVCSKVKELKFRNLSESESKMGVKLRAVDPKPSDLFMARLKRG